MDFNPDEGDILLLSAALWRRLGDLTPEQIVERFGVVTANGNIVLDFGPGANTVITLVDFDDLDLLSDHIHIL